MLCHIERCLGFRNIGQKAVWSYEHFSKLVSLERLNETYMSNMANAVDYFSASVIKNTSDQFYRYNSCKFVL